MKEGRYNHLKLDSFTSLLSDSGSIVKRFTQIQNANKENRYEVFQISHNYTKGRYAPFMSNNNKNDVNSSISDSVVGVGGTSISPPFSVLTTRQPFSNRSNQINGIARDRFKDEPVSDLKIVMRVCRAESDRKNFIGPSNEVGAIMVGDLEDTCGGRDIIIEREDGYHDDIPYEATKNNKGKKRKRMTQKEYYSYNTLMKQTLSEKVSITNYI
ncbi:hypothetical protein POM88_016664 [Heracleum sosnowskyi]|uniref:Uncharacterized protein n=1 Tax=Heracleum sosnowskyi TaxID=360622 RepID=A0AAD8MX57_9APIA|nr:hypothetical protein POM88_016664 [Heracleum sosnowskyi]